MNWKPLCSFRVDGQPRPQPRHRAFARKGKDGRFHARAFDPGTAEGWKAAVALAAKPFLHGEPVGGPVRVDVEFIFERPKGHFGTGRNSGVLKPAAPHWHTRGMGTNGGDRDNLDKAVLDALTQVGLWKDDGQVCDGSVRKRFAEQGERPGAVISVSVWRE